jgi:hypothetical protein
MSLDVKGLIHIKILIEEMGRDSSVGIATRYGLEGPGIESRKRERFSSTFQTGTGAHPPSCTMGLSRG